MQNNLFSTERRMNLFNFKQDINAENPVNENKIENMSISYNANFFLKSNNSYYSNSPRKDGIQASISVNPNGTARSHESFQILSEYNEPFKPNSIRIDNLKKNLKQLTV